MTCTQAPFVTHSHRVCFITIDEGGEPGRTEIRTDEWHGGSGTEVAGSTSRANNDLGSKIPTSRMNVPAENRAWVSTASTCCVNHVAQALIGCQSFSHISTTYVPRL